MFTYLDQTGTLGLRLPQDVLEVFLKKYQTTLFECYGVVKKDYVRVPDSLLKNTKELKKYLELSCQYVKTLNPNDASVLLSDPPFWDRMNTVSRRPVALILHGHQFGCVFLELFAKKLSVLR